MLASIHPLGERGRGNRWGQTATAYVVGSIAGGGALGSLLGYLGQLMGSVVGVRPTVIGFLVIAACLTGLMLDLGVAGSRLPTLRRQVDENWLGRYRGWVYGAGFGFQLGAGVATIVTSASVYLAFALAALSQSVLGGLAIGAVFGVVRAAPITLVRGMHEVTSLQRFHRRFQAAASAARRITLVTEGAALALGAGLTLVAARGTWPS